MKMAEHTTLVTASHHPPSKLRAGCEFRNFTPCATAVRAGFGVPSSQSNE